MLNMQIEITELDEKMLVQVLHENFWFFIRWNKTQYTKGPFGSFHFEELKST